jgi:hypothetical protein
MVGFKVGDIDRDGRKEIVILTALADESVSKVDILNERGERKNGLLNPGMLKDVILADIDDDEAIEILAAGYCDSEGAPALAVIDPVKLAEGGAGSAKGGDGGDSRNEGGLSSWTAEIERTEYYVLFPNTDIETAIHGRNVLARIDRIEGETHGLVEARSLLCFRFVPGGDLLGVGATPRFTMDFRGGSSEGESPALSLDSYLDSIKKQGLRYLKKR